VQQRLVAVRIRLALALEHATAHVAIRKELDVLRDNIDETIDELREVAHGLYPPVLNAHGLVVALDGVRRQTVTPVRFEAIGVGRYPAEVESAVYYCCVEAIQNATKHGGPGVQISVTLSADQDGDALRFEVTDDGPGFDSSVAHVGAGQQNMHDRVGALDGHVSIVTAVGGGTGVSGCIPLRREESPATPRSGAYPG
jgi:signal transduction histidine kinase